MESNELIESYLREVGRRLPGGQREDIIRELRSSIQDAIEARVGKGNVPAREDILAVLNQMGTPDVVAAEYKGRQRRRMDPGARKLFLYIILSFAIFGAAINVLLDLLREGIWSNTMTSGWLLPNSVTGLLCVIISIAAVFIIAWFLPKAMKKKKEMDLAGGSTAPTGEKYTWEGDARPVVRRMARIFRIAILLVVTIAVNFFTGSMGIYYTDQGGMVNFIPVVGSVLSSYIVLWDIALGAGLALAIVELIKGEKTIPTRIISLMISAFILVMAIVMLAGPSIIPGDTILNGYHGMVPAAQVDTALSAVGWVIFGVLLLVAVLSLYAVIMKSVRLVKAAKAAAAQGGY